MVPAVTAYGAVAVIDIQDIHSLQHFFLKLKNKALQFGDIISRMQFWIGYNTMYPS